MKAILLIVTTLIAPAFGDEIYTPQKLAEYVSQSPIIVIGHVSSLEGAIYSKTVAEFVLETDLVVTAVLKGNPPKPLRIRWKHHLTKGIEPLPAGKDAIWLLMKSKEDNLMDAQLDNRLPASMRPEIEKIIQIQKRRKKAKGTRAS